jgi:GTP-binding protein
MEKTQMNIVSARFIRGIIGTNDILYDGRFQVAFLGRSNVGKSTLINCLTNKKNLARSSMSPGKTIRMDFFLINNRFYFVDFPGYGYAKRSKDKREQLTKMMLWYLLDSKVKNRLIVLIIDAKVGITADDEDMIRILRDNKIDYLIVANKVDKIKMGQFKQTDAIPHSSKKKVTSERLMEKIAAFIK